MNFAIHFLNEKFDYFQSQGKILSKISRKLLDFLRNADYRDKIPSSSNLLIFRGSKIASRHLRGFSFDYKNRQVVKVLVKLSE